MIKRLLTWLMPTHKVCTVCEKRHSLTRVGGCYYCGWQLKNAR